MRRNYETELKKLTLEVVEMATLVDTMLNDAIKALQTKDLELAKDLVDRDDLIDDKEIYIEELCISLIATQCPIASDLRRVNTILRMITDLERIADHCVNISKAVLTNNGRDFMKPLVDLPRMQVICSNMISDAIACFVDEDHEKAKEIISRDQEVDELYEKIYKELLGILVNHQEMQDQAVLLLLIGRYLERVADHTTNIAERVIYMVTGKYH